MNKTDLVNEVAAKAQLNKVAAKAAVDAVLESIGQALANEDKVQLIGFGTFAVVEKPARTGINPQTKEKIEIAARKVVKFKPADGLGK
ncbi:MAG: HU family DNA-binding protein [Muribaculaceae bacterium]|nr:HU family DNA-binding protein [Muribaculaceae bacterium]